MRLSLLLLLCGCASAQTANLWIDTDGGTCTRQGTPASYSSASACASIQAALAAASNGDTVIMKSGSYGTQTITASKSSPGVTVRCENANWDTPLSSASASKNSCKIGTSGGTVTTNGAWYTLQDITYDPGDTHTNTYTWEARCSNCTFVNWNVHGDFVGIFWMPVEGSPGGNSTNIRWNGGELFDPANTSGTRNCTAEDNQPMWIAGMSDSGNFFGNGRIVNAIIENVVFNPAFVAGGTTCGGDPLHLERLRIDGNIDNLIVRKNIFADGGNENTGTMFISNFLGDVPTVTFQNNYISGDGTAVLQNNTGGSCPWKFLYNTWTSQPTWTGCSSGMTFTGNILMGLSACDGTHTKNVQTGSASACGTNFKETGSLGLTSFISQASLLAISGSGSSPVNRGETTCSSATTSANLEDIRGYARGNNGNCDAGAYEFGATGGGASAPTVTTTTATSITSTTASSGGNVTSDGGASVSARGVCWSTSANPTTSDTCTSDGTGTGSFTSSLTGLSVGTLYHYRAFATNSAGTGYGSDLTFTTLAVAPTVTTTTASSITATGASSGGNVTSDGGASVTSRGVCYGLSASPTSPCTSNGTGTGSFSSTLSGLLPGTTYNYRAFATNSIGTSYGTNLTFTTLSIEAEFIHRGALVFRGGAR